MPVASPFQLKPHLAFWSPAVQAPGHALAPHSRESTLIIDSPPHWPSSTNPTPTPLLTHAGPPTHRCSPAPCP